MSISLIQQIIYLRTGNRWVTSLSFDEGIAFDTVLLSDDRVCIHDNICMLTRKRDRAKGKKKRIDGGGTEAKEMSDGRRAPSAWPGIKITYKLGNRLTEQEGRLC